MSKNEAEKKSIIRSLLTSIENATTYVPFGWTQEHNDTTWNDTEVNMTYPNATVMPTKYNDKLIFGYFRFITIIIPNISFANKNFYFCVFSSNLGNCDY